MAIMAKSVGKYLSTHLMEASNGLTLEIVKDITSKEMERIEEIRTAIHAAYEMFGDEYRKQMQDACIRGTGELSGKSFRYEVSTILSVNKISSRVIEFRLGYNYRDESYSVVRQTPQLRLGTVRYEVLSPDANPLEKLLNQYIFGEIDSLDRFYGRLLTQFRNKAYNAYKNCTTRGTANYVYNQYVKEGATNPFTRQIITLDLFTNRELIQMYYGKISGTPTAVKQLCNTFNSFLNELTVDSLESSGLTQSLFDDFRSEFESGRGFKHFRGVLFSMLVKEFNEKGTMSLTQSTVEPYWNEGFVGDVLSNSSSISVSLDSKESFLDYIWNNLMNDEMKETVLGAKANVVVMPRSNFYFKIGNRFASPSSRYFESYVSNEDIRNAIAARNLIVKYDGKFGEYSFSGSDYIFNRSRLILACSLENVKYVEQRKEERIGVEPEVVIATSLVSSDCTIGPLTLINLAKKLSATIDTMDRQSTVLDADGEFTKMLDKYLTAAEYLDADELENLQWLRATVEDLDTSDYNVHRVSITYNPGSNSYQLVCGEYRYDYPFIALRK